MERTESQSLSIDFAALSSTDSFERLKPFSYDNDFCDLVALSHSRLGSDFERALARLDPCGMALEYLQTRAEVRELRAVFLKNCP